MENLTGVLNKEIHCPAQFNKFNKSYKNWDEESLFFHDFRIRSHTAIKKGDQ